MLPIEIRRLTDQPLWAMMRTRTGWGTVRTHAEMTMTNHVATNSVGDKRRDTGRGNFTTVLNFMLQDVSHPEMALLADWATNEAGCLHTSQMSHLRNQKMRMLGVKSLDALGRINTSAHAFKTDRSGVFRKLDTATTTPRIEEILERFDPVIHPDTGAPLDAGGLMMVYLGYLELPELVPAKAVEDADMASAAKKIGGWVEELLEERGLKFRDGLALIKDKWTGSDAGRDLFCQVVAGMADYKPEQLRVDLDNVAATITSLIDEDITGEEVVEAVNA